MKIILLWIILFVFLGCEKEDGIEISQANTDYISHFHDLADHEIVFQKDIIETIPLEKKNEIGFESGNNDFVFGEIKKIGLYQGLLFVLDADDLALKLYDFHTNDHINTFSLEGRGPGEVLYPEDMLINEDERSVLILDRQGKVVTYKIRNNQIVHEYDFTIEGNPESFCVIRGYVLIKNRLSHRDVFDDSDNISVYDKNTMAKVGKFGNTFVSDNWLLNDQLSRGFVECANSLNKVYSVSRYIPLITSYQYPGFDEIASSSSFLMGMDLINIIPSFDSNMQPVIEYNREKSGAIIGNIISHEYYVFIQLYELLRSGEEIFLTYQFAEEDGELILLNEYEGIGMIHQVTDSLIISSVNDPFPKIQIFSY
jgi:hypothetical protein